MKAERKTQLWTVAIAASAVIFMATVAVRQFHEYQRIQGELDQIQLAMNARPDVERELARLEREITRLSDWVDGDGKKIPRTAGLGEFVQELTRRAESCGVTPSEIKPGVAHSVDQTKVLPVTFRVRGSGKAIFDLIQSIEAMTRMTRFEQIVAEPSRHQVGEVEAEVCVSVFFREI